MPVIAVISLGEEAAGRLARACGLPLLYRETVERLAGRVGTPARRIARLLDGSAGLLERLTADRTSLSICCADEILSCAAKGRAAVMPAWGVSRLLSGAPQVACIGAGESPARCMDTALALMRSGSFAQTDASQRRLEDLALVWRVRAALRLSAPTRGLRIAVGAERGRITLEGIVDSGAQRSDAGEVAAGVAGVRSLDNLLRAADGLRPRFT